METITLALIGILELAMSIADNIYVSQNSQQIELRFRVSHSTNDKFTHIVQAL